VYIERETASGAVSNALQEFFIGLEQMSQRGRGRHPHDIRRAPRVRIGLSRVGVTNLERIIRLTGFTVSDKEQVHAK
jgi:hypothetical protein